MKKLKHLSKEWIEALDSTAKSHKDFLLAISDIQLLLEYRIIDEEEICWQINIQNGSVEISLNNSKKPDVWFETSRMSAVLFLEGKIDPLQAVMDGTLNMGGDPRKLLEASKIFEQLEDIFKTIREITIT